MHFLKTSQELLLPSTVTLFSPLKTGVWVLCTPSFSQDHQGPSAQIRNRPLSSWVCATALPLLPTLSPSGLPSRMCPLKTSPSPWPQGGSDPLALAPPDLALPPALCLAWASTQQGKEVSTQPGRRLILACSDLKQILVSGQRLRPGRGGEGTKS